MKKKEFLPNLSQIAREVLSIPASSSASERLFSAAGIFDTEKRSRLNPKTLEILTLLKSNQQLLESEDANFNEFQTETDRSSSSESKVEEDESSEESSEGDKEVDDEGDDMENMSGIDSEHEMDGDNSQIYEPVEELINSSLEEI